MNCFHHQQSPAFNLKRSITVYQHKGDRLRFSRRGEPKIEEAYSTHLVVVGKRNPFAVPDAGTISCDKKSESESEGPLSE